ARADDRGILALPDVNARDVRSLVVPPFSINSAIDKNRALHVRIIPDDADNRKAEQSGWSRQLDGVAQAEIMNQRKRTGHNHALALSGDTVHFIRRASNRNSVYGFANFLGFNRDHHDRYPPVG